MFPFRSMKINYFFLFFLFSSKCTFPQAIHSTCTLYLFQTHWNCITTQIKMFWDVDKIICYLLLELVLLIVFFLHLSIRIDFKIDISFFLLFVLLCRRDIHFVSILHFQLLSFSFSLFIYFYICGVILLNDFLKKKLKIWNQTFQGCLSYGNALWIDADFVSQYGYVIHNLSAIKRSLIFQSNKNFLSVFTLHSFRFNFPFQFNFVLMAK